MHKTDHFAEGRSSKQEIEYNQLDAIVAKKLAIHETMAEELNRSQIHSEALPLGLHPMEREQYYSQNFSMSPRFVTNKGLLKIKNRNIDYIHIIQRY